MTGCERHEYPGVALCEVLAGLERDGFVVEAARLRAAVADGRPAVAAFGAAPGRTTLVRDILRDLEWETP